MHFSSDNFNFSRSIFKYTLILITECVNKFVVYSDVLADELSVVHMGSNILLLIIYQKIFNKRII